jgi:hypothetical protein
LLFLDELVFCEVVSTVEKRLCLVLTVVVAEGELARVLIVSDNGYENSDCAAECLAKVSLVIVNWGVDLRLCMLKCFE